MKRSEIRNGILTEHFGKDLLVALDTVADGVPHVRMVDAVYIGGAFYAVTYARSGKMQRL